MGYDFFDELSNTITRTSKDLSKRAGQIYEAQKIRNRLAGEEHMVEKLKADMGNLLYQRYKDGGEIDEELKVICEEIDQHMQIIAGYRDAAAEIKGRKICPACEKAVDRSVSFCPYCGAPCPTPEPEKAEGEVVDTEGNPCDCGSDEPAEEAGEPETAGEEAVSEETEQPAETAADESLEQEIPKPVEEEVKSE